jgi:3-oxoacyl-[acyl-carrier protein] reductase
MANKVVLVTGASKGIGQSIALAFAKANYDVIIHYHQDVKGARHTQEQCHKLEVNTHLTCCDLSSFQDTQNMIKESLKHFKRLDVLVCNAGINKDKLLLMMSESDFNHVLDVNLRGLFNVVKPCAKIMARQKSGCILAIGSTVATLGNVGQSNYAASKAGMVGFIKSVALEMAPYHVRCNVIAPGLIDSSMSQVLDEKQKQGLLHKTALKRMGQKDDVAQLALFLASDAASYITSQQFFVDGGMLGGG